MDRYTWRGSIEEEEKHTVGKVANTLLGHQ